MKFIATNRNSTTEMPTDTVNGSGVAFTACPTVAPHSRPADEAARPHANTASAFTLLRAPMDASTNHISASKHSLPAYSSPFANAMQPDARPTSTTTARNPPTTNNAAAWYSTSAFGTFGNRAMTSRMTIGIKPKNVCWGLPSIEPNVNANPYAMRKMKMATNSPCANGTNDAGCVMDASTGGTASRMTASMSSASGRHAAYMMNGSRNSVAMLTVASAPMYGSRSR